jgi:hypothetical protein
MNNRQFMDEVAKDVYQGSVRSPGPEAQPGLCLPTKRQGWNQTNCRGIGL